MLLAVQRQVRCWFVRRREFGCGVAVFSCRHAGFLGGADSGQFCSKVWPIPGTRIESLRPVFMHMVDLGVTQQVSGNVSWFLFDTLGGRRHGAPLASRAVCAKIRKMADMTARETGLDTLHLTLTVRKFRAQNKPKLALKAAEGRHFWPILLKVPVYTADAGQSAARVVLR